MGATFVASRGSERDISPDGPFHARVRSERRDFDDGANSFWSLYGKEARSHDEARFLSLAADMEGLLLFVRFYHRLRFGLAFIPVYIHRAACFLSFSPFSSFKASNLCN